MKCNKCGFEWVNRVEKPKECPDCKTRLKYKKEEKVVEKEVVDIVPKPPIEAKSKIVL